MNYASTLLSAFLRLVVYEKRKFSYYQWHSLFLAAAWKPELETKLSFAVTKKGENTCEKGENNMDRRKNIIPVLSCYAHDDGEDNESSEICIFNKKKNNISAHAPRLARAFFHNDILVWRLSDMKWPDLKLCGGPQQFFL